MKELVKFGIFIALIGVCWKFGILAAFCAFILACCIWGKVECENEMDGDD